MVIKIKILIFLLFVYDSTMSKAFCWDGIAIMGDGVVTGTASHENLSYDPKVLWKVFSGEIEVNPTQAMTKSAPKRLWPVRRENDGSIGWMWGHLIQAVFRVAVDTEEYSFGSILGGNLNIDQKNIWIAGDSGAHSANAVEQADRILKNSKGMLPKHMIIMFSQSDLCASNWDFMTDAKEYANGIYQSLKYLSRHGKNQDGEVTKVVIPAFLSVTSLLQNEKILNKKIGFYGSETTCLEARKRLFAPPDSVDSPDQNNDPRYQLFSQVMPLNPVLFCPTVFAVGPKDEDKISLLANRVRSFRDEVKLMVKKFNDEQEKSKAGAAINAVYDPATEDLSFEGEDVGGDCYHLTYQGQEKIAKALTGSIK